MYNPREMLASAGHLTPTTSRHAPEILRALDEHPCKDCGRPVGREARSSSQCLDCLRKEFEADGLALGEFDRMASEMRAPHPSNQTPA